MFLGATQLRGGLFNVWGTVIAVLLLGTVNVGLALASVPQWTPYLFDGAVLIAALGLRRLEGRRATGGSCAAEASAESVVPEASGAVEEVPARLGGDGAAAEDPPGGSGLV